MKNIIAAFAVLALSSSLSSSAHAANLPQQCYQDAMGYAKAKVQSLSANVVAFGRIGELAGTEANADNGYAEVTIEMQAEYANGLIQNYVVVVPVQVDDENGCSVFGQAEIYRN